MAILLNNILEKILNHNNDWRFKLIKNWDKVACGLATRIRLESIFATTVVIGVYEAHWMQELFLLSNIILDNINKVTINYKVTNIKFKLVSADKKINQKKYNLNKSCTNSIMRAPAVLNETQKLALKRLNNQDLENVLISFLARCQEK